MATEKQAVNTIADAIIKATKAFIKENNKSYVDNQIANHGGSGGTGGSGVLTGTILASQVNGLESTVSGYIANASGSLLSALNAIADSRLESYLPTAIGNVNISYEQITGLNSTSSSIQRLFATDIISGKIVVNDLAVTDANIVNLAVGDMMLRNSNGEFVKIVVDAETGTVGSEIVTFDGDDIIASGSLNGNRIIERSITADRIVAGAITANEIAAGTITANLLNANEIFSSSAILSTISTNVIQAINNGADLSGADFSSNSFIYLSKFI